MLGLLGSAICNAIAASVGVKATMKPSDFYIDRKTTSQIDAAQMEYWKRKQKQWQKPQLNSKPNRPGSG